MITRAIKIRDIDNQVKHIEQSKVPFMDKFETTIEENNKCLDLLSQQKTLVEDLQIELNKKLVNISNQQKEIALRNK